MKNLNVVDNVKTQTLQLIIDKIPQNNSLFYNMLYNSKNNFNNILDKIDNYSYILKINVMSINLYVQPLDQQN